MRKKVRMPGKDKKARTRFYYIKKENSKQKKKHKIIQRKITYHGFFGIGSFRRQ